MPQFDPFIFESTLFFFITFYLIYLYFNTNLFLPYLASILKFRHKFVRDIVQLYHRRLTPQKYVSKNVSQHFKH